MVVGDEPVVEAQPDQGQVKVVDRLLRQSLDVAAQLVAEVPDPSAAKHAGRRGIRPL